MNVLLHLSRVGRFCAVHALLCEFPMAEQNLILIDEFSARELRRMQRKLDGVRGPNVKNSPNDITIGPTRTPPKNVNPTRPQQTLPVPEYVYMSLQAVAQNVLGADFERLHPMILG